MLYWNFYQLHPIIVHIRDAGNTIMSNYLKWQQILKPCLNLQIHKTLDKNVRKCLSFTWNDRNESTDKI